MRHHRDDPGPSWGVRGGRPVHSRHGRSPRVPWPEFSGGPRLNKFVAKIKLSVAPSARGEKSSPCQTREKNVGRGRSCRDLPQAAERTSVDWSEIDLALVVSAVDLTLRSCW